MCCIREPEVESRQRCAMASTPRVLLAEDDGEFRSLLSFSLGAAGFHVIECADGHQLASALGDCLLPEDQGRRQYDLIISDIRMPGMSGLEALEVVGSSSEYPPMVLITAFGDAWTHQEARRLGAAAIVDKPFDPDKLVSLARGILYA